MTQTPGAQPAASRTLSVERDPGTETCPDADALAVRVEALRAQEPTQTLPFRVRFVRTVTSFSARIESDSGTRLLSSRGVDCEGLAQATAVTLALLVDSELSNAPLQESAAQPEVPRPVAPAPSRSVPVPALARHEEVRGSLALGGLALLGEIAPVVPAVAADAGLRTGRVRTSLGTLVSFPRRFELGPGEVSVQLLLLDARLCVAAARVSSRVDLEMCGGAWLGIASARAKGFSDDRARHEPWLALPLELGLLGRAAEHLYFEGNAGVTLPITRREFAVDGLGTAYEAPAIGGFLALRVGFFI